jgi:hypothetical protein
MYIGLKNAWKRFMNHRTLLAFQQKLVFPISEVLGWVLAQTLTIMTKNLVFSSNYAIITSIDILCN